MRQALHGVDTVFLLRKSASMALIAKSAGVRTVVGYDKQRFPAPVGYRRWGLGLDRVARYPSLGTHTPQARSHLGLLHACNLLADDTTLALWDTPDDHAALNALLAQAGVAPEASLAVFHASSASHGKTFAPEVFFPALAALRDAGLAIACVGAAADAPAYEAMAARLGLCEGDGRWANLAGRASLPQTVALCRRSRLALTVDSGPMHLAAAAQTPAIVGVFGPTNERQWGPPPTAQTRFWPVFEPLPCRPCYAKTCAHNACRLTLDPQRILSAVRQALSPDAAMPTG